MSVTKTRRYIMLSIFEYAKINIRKLSIRQIIILTLVETIFLITAGLIMSFVNSDIRVYIPDYMFVIITAEVFEMISAVKKAIADKNGIIHKILFWSKLTMFALISYIYLMIILQIPFIDFEASVFSNLKLTSLITMILMAGLDSALDCIYEDDME